MFSHRAPPPLPHAHTKESFTKLHERWIIFSTLLLVAAAAVYLFMGPRFVLIGLVSFRPLLYAILCFMAVLSVCVIVLVISRIRSQNTAAAGKKAAINKLLLEVATETSRAVSVDAALQACLDAVCIHTGWPIGHAYVIAGVKAGEEQRSTLVSSRLWHPNRTLHDQQDAFAAFHEATERIPLEPGAELSGRVLQENAPVWIESIPESPGFTRASAARMAGIQAAFAFPVMAGHEAVAVLEFFTREPARADPGLLPALLQIGALLGRVFERERALAEITESEGKFRAVSQSAADATLIADGQGRITFWNPRAEAVFGYPSALAIGRELTFILPPHYHDAHREALSRFLAGGETGAFSKNLELEALHQDGRIFPVEISLSGWMDQGRRYFSGSVRDISSRVVAHVKQRELNNKLNRNTDTLRVHNREIKLLSELAGLLHASKSDDEIFDLVGRYGERLVTYGGALYIHDKPSDLLESRAAWGSPTNRRMNFAAGDCWAIRLGKPYFWEHGKTELRCNHVSENPVSSLCIPMFAEDEACGVYFWQDFAAGVGGSLENKQPLLVSLAGQVTMALRHLRLQDTLQMQSVRDPLTGLFNRRYMEESLGREMQRALRRKHSLALVMFDLDHFKNYNDTLGHPAGDALLRELCDRLVRITRKDDILCRYGGDEFLLIMTEASCAVAFGLAEQMGETCRSLLNMHGHPGCEVTLSLGVAASPEHGKTPAELIGAVDAALYRAKRAGGNRAMMADLTSILNPAGPSPFVKRATPDEFQRPAPRDHPEKN